MHEQQPPPVFNIHEAKTHLSRLVEDAANGRPFVIAKAGRPMVRVIAIVEPEAAPVQRIGFMRGEFKTPDDFDTMDQDEIIRMFDGPAE